MKQALNTWNPLRELEDFQHRILSAFSPARTTQDGGNQRMTNLEWVPLVDITEADDSYLILAEIPQVEKDDVKVTVENGTLNIRGERRLEKVDEAKTRYHRLERAYGAFARSFSLPPDADPSRVEAQFRDGVLRLRVPKSEEARPKQIEVQVN